MEGRRPGIRVWAVGGATGPAGARFPRPSGGQAFHVGLEFARVSKRYGRTVALDDLSFEVAAGEVFGFVGPNGAGKTTAMRIALGVLAADSGVVCWDGTPLTLEMRRRVGYMPEERGLYPKMKVRDQLVYFARLHGMTGGAARRAIEDWAQRLGVADRVSDDLPKLSLGNQQRVQLAAALVHDPDILVLDEPFSGLDPVAVDVMSDVLRAQARAGVPVLFSSHQLQLVEQLCDRVGIVNAGRLVACGRVADLRDTGPARYVVDVPDAPPSWLPRLPGVRVVSTSGSRTEVELAPGTDDQAVLRAALSVGRVAEFAPKPPSLNELFRHVM